MKPCACNSSITLSQWSPCTSMTPSLTVPPVPHCVFNSFPNSFNAVGSNKAPRTTVTDFPPRPFVSRETRTMPSPVGTDGRLQMQSATERRHTGHMRPWSVEYTNPPRAERLEALFFIAPLCAGLTRHLRDQPTSFPWRVSVLWHGEDRTKPPTAQHFFGTHPKSHMDLCTTQRREIGLLQDSGSDDGVLAVQRDSA